MAEADTRPAMEVEHLTRRFGDFVAVDDASFTVPRGEIFGLIGPNGAGKSTLIKMLTTLLPPSAGAARVAGFDIAAQSAEVRRRIGYVPQLLSADGALTGVENLTLSARLYGVPRAERRERIELALATMGLQEAAHRLVGSYSGGMIRRLEIAQSMLHRPDVLFLDEPTVGLDPVARRTVWEHVRELSRTLRTTMLITTHYMEEVDELCHRVAVMQRGRIAEIGPPAVLKAEIGPDATLDDVFARLTGLDERGSYRDVRQTRLAVREHG
jgi:ABC-2 type transport system ATP-binding protein